MNETQSFYLGHGRWTEPGTHGSAMRALNGDLPSLCAAVQSTLVHLECLRYYDLQPDEIPPIARATEPVARRLDRLTALDGASFLSTRLPQARNFGTCRDFALLLCALLREHGVPARVRCGFASYLSPTTNMDHWIFEYWLVAQQRWVMADAQLDQAHMNDLAIEFDPCELPPSAFMFAWQAWRRCRDGDGDPDSYGHAPHTGWWFLRVNLVRDLLAFQNQEVSDWDNWRQSTSASNQLSDEAFAECDEMAKLAASINDPASNARSFSAPQPPWRGTVDELN